MSLSELVFLLFLLAFGNLPFTHFLQPILSPTPPAISAHVPLDAHPHDVARLFIEEHVAGATHGYYIRNDSYTDQVTGISHVYARQLLHGLEIIDGDVNLNIRDGKVLSYGNSFFNGGLPWSIQSPTYDLEEYCWEIPSKTDPFACEVSLDRMRTATSIYSSSIREHENSPVPAAFFFTLAVYPEVLRRDTYLQSAYTAAGPEPCTDPFEDTFASECWSIYVLPGVIAPVKARKVYVQTWLFGWENTKLSLAWRLEVKLEDNYYEVYVYERDPASIIAVIDWVSDGPALKPSRPSKSPQDKVTTSGKTGNTE